MIKKIGSKKQPIETLVFDKPMPKELNSLVGELIFDYPTEIDEAIARVQEWIKHPQEEQGLTVPEHILKMFENEARSLLKRNQHPIAPEELLTIEENTMDIASASARHVLLLVPQVRENFLNGNQEQMFIDLFKMLVSAIKVQLHSFVVSGVHRDTEVRPKLKNNAEKDRKPQGKNEIEKYMVKKAKEYMGRNKDATLTNVTEHIFNSHKKGGKKGFSESTIKNLLRPLFDKKSIR